MQGQALFSQQHTPLTGDIVCAGICAGICTGMKAGLPFHTSGFGSGPDPKGPLDLNCYSLPVAIRMLKDQQFLPLFGVEIMMGSENLPEIR